MLSAPNENHATTGVPSDTISGWVIKIIFKIILLAGLLLAFYSLFLFWTWAIALVVSALWWIGYALILADWSIALAVSTLWWIGYALNLADWSIALAVSTLWWMGSSLIHLTMDVFMKWVLFFDASDTVLETQAVIVAQEYMTVFKIFLTLYSISLFVESFQELPGKQKQLLARLAAFEIFGAPMSSFPLFARLFPKVAEEKEGEGQQQPPPPLIETDADRLEKARAKVMKHIVDAIDKYHQDNDDEETERSGDDESVGNENVPPN